MPSLQHLLLFGKPRLGAFLWPCRWSRSRSLPGRLLSDAKFFECLSGVVLDWMTHGLQKVWHNLRSRSKNPFWLKGLGSHRRITGRGNARFMFFDRICQSAISCLLVSRCNLLKKLNACFMSFYRAVLVQLPPSDTLQCCACTTPPLRGGCTL